MKYSGWNSPFTFKDHSILGSGNHSWATSSLYSQCCEIIWTIMTIVLCSIFYKSTTVVIWQIEFQNHAKEKQRKQKCRFYHFDFSTSMLIVYFYCFTYCFFIIMNSHYCASCCTIALRIFYWQWLGFCRKIVKKKKKCNIWYITYRAMLVLFQVQHDAQLFKVTTYIWVNLWWLWPKRVLILCIA